MNLELIKKQVETNQSFQHYNKTTGLTFNDLQVSELVGSHNYTVVKNGNVDFQILIKDNVIERISFNPNNETIKNHRLAALKSL